MNELRVELLQNLMLVEERRNETRGKFNFYRHFLTIKKNGRVHFADYFEAVGAKMTVTPCETLLFSKRPYNAGERILVDGAGKTCTTYNSNGASTIEGPRALLYIQIARELSRTPSLATDYFKLYNRGITRAHGVGSIVDGTPVTDIFLVQTIAEHNSHFFPERALLFNEINTPGTSTSAGLWIKASYIDHSCVSNCSRSFLSDMLIVRTVKPIAINEAMTFSYINPLQSYQGRHRDLRQWNISCTCRLCKYEGSLPSAVLDRLEALAGELEDLMNRTPNVRVGDQTIKKVKSCLQKLQSAYDPDLGLPCPIAVKGPLAHQKALGPG
ncbi:hypothetical protein M501DRAFT_362241 [Patellaria atrata CBS 101060]|uniref:SET domain-containing protein n=1 Tax=Patellaria atrata CBS 101060 TaxID=1346257 RepID=A0A9P4VTX8_9PEZI|nr:hypothetical protein M501DRAFT_362241 [Patellaria atrata CBS 101060]